MSRSIKLKNNTYLDTSASTHNYFNNHFNLKDIIDMLMSKAPPNNDFNQATRMGLYTWTHATANAPLSGNTYGIIICLTSYGIDYNGRDNWLFQIAIRTDSTNGIWIRRKINAGDWQSWVLIS